MYILIISAEHCEHLFDIWAIILENFRTSSQELEDQLKVIRTLLANYLISVSDYLLLKWVLASTLKCFAANNV